MVTKREYTCDLCGARIFDFEGPTRDIGTPGIGIHFDGRNRIERRTVTTVDHHVCINCLAGMKKLIEEQFAGFVFGD